MAQILMKSPDGTIGFIDSAKESEALELGYKKISKHDKLKNEEGGIISANHYLEPLQPQNSTSYFKEVPKALARGALSRFNIPKLIAQITDAYAKYGNQYEIMKALDEGEFGNLTPDEKKEILEQIQNFTPKLADKIPSAEEAVKDLTDIDLTPNKNMSKTATNALEFAGDPLGKGSINLIKNAAKGGKTLFDIFKNAAKETGINSSVGAASGMVQNSYDTNPLVTDLAASAIVPNIANIGKMAAQKAAKGGLNFTGLSEKHFQPEVYEAFKDLNIKNLPLSYYSKNAPFLVKTEEILNRTPFNTKDNIQNINSNLFDTYEKIKQASGREATPEVKDLIQKLYNNANEIPERQYIIDYPNTKLATKKILSKKKFTPAPSSDVKTLFDRANNIFKAIEPQSGITDKDNISLYGQKIVSKDPEYEKLIDKIKSQANLKNKSEGSDLKIYVAQRPELNAQTDFKDFGKVDTQIQEIKHAMDKDVQKWIKSSLDKKEKIPPQIYDFLEANKLHHQTEKYDALDKLQNRIFNQEQNIMPGKFNQIFNDKKQENKILKIIDPSMLKAFKDLKTANKAIANRSRNNVNTSGTATTTMAADVMKKSSKKIAESLGLIGGGASLAYNPLLASLIFGGLYGTPKILTSQKIADYAYKNAKKTLPKHKFNKEWERMLPMILTKQISTENE